MNALVLLLIAITSTLYGQPLSCKRAGTSIGGQVNAKR